MSTLTSKEYEQISTRKDPNLLFVFKKVKQEHLAMGMLLGFPLGVYWSMTLGLHF